MILIALLFLLAVFSLAASMAAGWAAWSELSKERRMHRALDGYLAMEGE